MSRYSTFKSSKSGRAETLRRREVRAVKYGEVL